MPDEGILGIQRDIIDQRADAQVSREAIGDNACVIRRGLPERSKPARIVEQRPLRVDLAVHAESEKLLVHQRPEVGVDCRQKEQSDALDCEFLRNWELSSLPLAGFHRSLAALPLRDLEQVVLCR